jgi:hypothetical protein
MAQQQHPRDLPEDWRGFRKIHCGRCARNFPDMPPPLIAFGTSRPVTSEFREVTWPSYRGAPEWEESEDSDLGLGYEELLALADTRKRPYGFLFQIQRDAPKVSLAELRVDVAERNALLNEEQIGEIVQDELGRRRSTLSADRRSYVEVDVKEGVSSIECWCCGRMFEVNRSKLAKAIEKIRDSSDHIYLTPKGLYLSLDAVPLRSWASGSVVPPEFSGIPRRLDSSPPASNTNDVV